MKVLFVDDQTELIETTVVDKLPESVLHKICCFEDTIYHLQNFRPDIVVLDLRRDNPADGHGDGVSSYHRIWEHRFRPIIVFSAFPEMLKANVQPHPFVRYVQKGGKGGSDLVSEIAALEEQVKSITSAEQEFDKQASIALRDVAPVIFEEFSDSNARNEAILRTTQRRIAAMIDETSLRPSSLKPWEQYIFPPVVEDLITGDIIRLIDSDGRSAADFGVILTPSCDLVCSGGRSPKVRSVLVGLGKDITEGCGPLSLPSNEKKRQEKLKEYVGNLNSAMFFLPAIPSAMPPICINLKELTMIPIEDLLGNSAKYKKIASIDSPFREEIVWFLLQTVGRPGVPDRDKEEWARSIGSSISSTQT